MDFPFVLICQGSDAHSYLEMPVRRKLIVDAANTSRGVITRSADLARRLRDAGVDKNLLHPIYNGVDTEVFFPTTDRRDVKEKLGLEPEAEHLLFVGNFLPVKNPLLLIEAWGQARSEEQGRDLRLVMIGAGPMEAEIRGAVESAGLTGFLTMPGRLPSVQVAEYMRACSCLVMSSHNEGVPNVVLESFASGLPVVSTDVGGISEVLNDGAFGETGASRVVRGTRRRNI